MAEVLGRNSVNIRGVSTDLGPTRPVVRLVTDDENSARKALEGANINFAEREVIVLGLQDRSGELAKLTKALSKSGINIESLYILGTKSGIKEIALSVDRMDDAKEILSKYLI